MVTIKNFEDLAIWRMSREIVNQFYRDFRKCRDFGFRDQATRAGISIMNNISEGFCRGSDAEFRQFLDISKGSAGEVHYQLLLAKDLGYLDEEKYSDLRDGYHRVLQMLQKLFKSLS